LTLDVCRFMLAPMPRSNVFVRVAFVSAFALAVLGCSGAAPPTPAPATPTPAPTPAPSVDLSAKYANAMIAAFAADPLVLHVEQSVKATASYDAESKKIDATMTLDLSDRDLKMHLETTAAKKTTKMDMIVVGTSVYARVGGAHWQLGTRSNYEQSLSDITRALQPVRNPAILGYVGVETVDKQKLVHLTAAKAFPYISADGQRGTYDSFDIWVKDDGTPVLAKGKISMVGAYGVEIKGTSELHFSKFGGSIEIVAPKT
jgi:hypothetical protein